MSYKEPINVLVCQYSHGIDNLVSFKNVGLEFRLECEILLITDCAIVACSI